MSASSPLHRSAPHESAVGHVTGRARFVDDLPEPQGLLHGALIRSPVARGRLLALDLEPVRRAPGVEAVLTAADIPGDRFIGPLVHDEPLLGGPELLFHGQALALVLARSAEQARAAARLARPLVDEQPPVLDIEEAITRGRFHGEPHRIARGDLDAAFARAAFVVEGEVRSGGQDHFYLETMAALALPEEDGAIRILSSTQHPTEAQKMAARVLGRPAHLVICEVPRLGGGFGGKESQATAPACLAALGAAHTGRPCKLRFDREEDMRTTGGRHPFASRYRAALTSDGLLLGLYARLYSDGGCTFDLSLPVLDRALFHLDNAYFIEAVDLEGRVCHTDKPTNTAFRGFGGPQGMVVIEAVMREVARRLGRPTEEIRRRNYYGPPPRDRAPYGQAIPEPRIAAMHEALARSAGLEQRRAEVAAYNASSPWFKRGLDLQPVKFGISFTASLLNQAGALVLVFADGSVQLNHGGTEMGQGLHSKMRAVAADAFGLPAEAVRVMPTSTEKVPNTSPTAASSGSDLNGQAVAQACAIVRERMEAVAAEAIGRPVRFEDGRVLGPAGALSFAELASRCWARQVSLSSTGFYATPGIGYDRAAGQGTPFFYFAYGIALVEVELCGLTGEHRLRRVDILHDVGDSLLPNIDRGQVEGAFVQGYGWLTGEQVIFDDRGALRTRGPSTYKIPSAGDVPLAFHVELLPHAAQGSTIGGSKAVGEPPFMLAIGVVGALEEAVAAFGEGPLRLELPATPEALLDAIERRRGVP